MDAPKRALQLAIIRPDTRAVNAQRVAAATTGRGGGGGEGATNLPKETYVVSDPAPGVWEVRLTDVEDTRTFDWQQAESRRARATDRRRRSPSKHSESLPATRAPLVSRSRALPARRCTMSHSTNQYAAFSGRRVGLPVGGCPPRSTHDCTARAAGLGDRRPRRVDASRCCARAAKPSDGNADLDIYVYDCTGKECKAAGYDADPFGDETVTVQESGRAGKWKVVVDAASVPSGRTSYDYLDVVFNQSFGAGGGNRSTRRPR